MSSSSDDIQDSILDFCKNNDINKIISSRKNLESVCCLGIDEAGRGPVLGPMVYAGAYVEIKNLQKIKKIGLDDSKKLKEEVREELLEKLTDKENKLCGYEIEIISPNYISNQMLNTSKTNLNTISHNSAIDIIKRVIGKGVNLREVYLDTVGPADKYQQLIQSHFPGLKVVVETKADSKYAVVSAASIFAKVTRDRCIVNWQHRELSMSDYSREYGSGYPGDPFTKQFLQTAVDPIFGFPSFVRASWSTAYTIVNSKCIPIEWEDHGEQIAESKNQQLSKLSNKRKIADSIDKNTSKLFGKFSPIVSTNTRSRFYRSRKMERVTTL